MRIGYARVSIRDQNVDMQLDALNKAGCKRVFTDKLSGAHVERPGLREASPTSVMWAVHQKGALPTAWAALTNMDLE